MIPAATVCRCVAAVLIDLRDRMSERADRNRRPVSPDLRQSRRRKAADLDRQVGRLYALVDATKGKAVDAATLGCLCALAQGHGDAARLLEDHLHAAGHPAADRVEGLPASDVAGIVEAILNG